MNLMELEIDVNTLKGGEHEDSNQHTRRAV